MIMSLVMLGRFEGYSVLVALIALLGSLPAKKQYDGAGIYRGFYV